MLGENVTPARVDDLLQHVTLRIKGPSRIKLRIKSSSQFEGDRYVGVYASRDAAMRDAADIMASENQLRRIAQLNASNPRTRGKQKHERASSSLVSEENVINNDASYDSSAVSDVSDSDGETGRGKAKGRRLAQGMDERQKAHKKHKLQLELDLLLKQVESKVLEMHKNSLEQEILRKQAELSDLKA